jgi:MinD-like ATPase involved in chromosome partitioning or flagellar assembly
MSKLLLVSRSRKFENRLRGLLGDELETIMGRSLGRGASAVLGRLDADDRPELALLGPSLSHAQAYELSTGLASLYPGVGIMLVGESSAGMGRWASEMNARAVLSPSASDDALLAAVDRRPIRRPLNTSERETESDEELDAAPETEAEGAGLNTDVGVDTDVDAEATGADLDAPGDPVAEPDDELPGIRNQVIAVASPKGGMGKTTVATNLAVGLAKLAPMSVVLIDADVQFGDVATALSLEPSFTLPDAVSEAAATDSIVLKSFLTPHQAGFYTICGADSPIEGDRVTGEQLTRLIQQLSEVFRFVVIDTAPGLGEHTLAALELATDAVILCGMSVPSMRGLRKDLDVLDRIGIEPENRHIVLNFADRLSGVTVRDVEATAGVPVDLAIPRSSAVVLSTNRGVPLLETGDRNPASTALAGLVARFDPSAKPKRRRLHKRVVVA